MSQKNVELVDQAFQAWNDERFEGFRDYLAPEFEFHEDPRFPESGVYRGIDAVEAYAEQFFAAWQSHDWVLEETIPVGEDRVLTRFMITWRGEGSGVELEVRSTWLWTVRAGKAVKCQAFLEHAEALEAGGLTE